MLSCRELVEEVTADPDLIAGHGRLRWSIRLHLLMCRHCRRFVRQLRVLLRTLAASQARREDQVDAETVERIWQAIENGGTRPS